MSTYPASAIKPGALYDAINAVKGSDQTIPLGSVRGATGLIPTATLAANVWAWVISASVAFLSSNTADGATSTANGFFTWQVPETWVTGQALVVALTVKLKSVTGTGVGDNGSGIDLTCFKQASFAVGSDLCSTAPQTFAALDTVYTKTFTIDSGSLAAGDVLNFTVVGTAIENNAGNGTLQVELEGIKVTVSNPS